MLRSVEIECFNLIPKLLYTIHTHYLFRLIVSFLLQNILRFAVKLYKMIVLRGSMQVKSSQSCLHQLEENCLMRTK